MKLPRPDMSTRRLGLAVVFSTPSRSNPETIYYTMCLTQEGARWVCTCPGWNFKGECGHIDNAKEGLPSQLKGAIDGNWP